MTAPQKDIIYIDVEDDITAIIGKMKNAEHGIVALVPPKRMGVLQSAVNLRLLERAANQHGKKLVIITGNKSLIGLAAVAKIPVAKNLQSKPELGEIAALDIDNGEEVIDGAELPVGDHAKMSESSGTETAAASAIGAAAVANGAKDGDAVDANTSRAGKSSVPNFDVFRKKLFLIVGGAIALIVFIVWAVWFAPFATVTVATRTIDATISQQVTLASGAVTDPDQTTIQAERKTSTQEISIPFDATGKKDVGEKASGTVTITVTDWNQFRGGTIEAGTELESGSGNIYLTNEEVNFGVTDWVGGNDSKSVGVTAADRGASYNGATGSVSGTPRGTSASFDSATSGGTDKTVSIVTRSDVDTARAKISEEINEDTAKQTLSKQFGDGYIIIADSFEQDTGDIEPAVAVGSEASGGKAELKGNVEYSLFAVAKPELVKYLEAVIAEQIDNPDEQKVFETGVDDATFSDVEESGTGLSATLDANGAIGPKIDAAQVREIAAGKNYGEIQAALEAINGVESVETDFSPFWVSRAPDNINKISVEFQLNEQ